MMGREWKAGDVGMVDGQVAYCGEADGYKGRPLTFTWTDIHGDPCSVYVASEPEARPLLVIDPENGEQVDRLRALASEWADQVPYDDMAAPGDLTHLTAMQAALRAMLESPAPPKPDEPGRLGVVEARAHSSATWEWVQWGNPGAGARSWRNLIGDAVAWDELHDVTVIRPGITPDEPEAEEALPPDLIDGDGDVWVWCGNPSRTASAPGYDMCWGQSSRWSQVARMQRSEVEAEMKIDRELPHGTAVTP